MLFFGSTAGAAGADTDGFFAWAAGALVVAPGAALEVVVEGRAVVALRVVEEDSEARGVVRDAGPSTEGRVVAGRFAAVVVAAAGRVVVGLAGDDLVAELAANVVRRTLGFLFSSPDVTEDRSGSASEAEAFEANPVLRTVVPGGGRVGGFPKLEPTVPAREVALVVGLVAVVAVRVVLEAAGRRAAAVTPAPTVGRRGGTGSLDVDEAFEAILRRVAGDAGVAGVRDVLFGDSWGAAVVVGSASLGLGGGGGESIAAAANGANGLLMYNAATCDNSVGS